MLLRIKYERLRRGLRQEAVATAAKVSASDLGKIERGQYVPPPGSVVLARLAGVLDTPVAELLRLVEMQAIETPQAPAPAEIPTPVPAIPPVVHGPTPLQLAARARQRQEEAECEAINKAAEEPVPR